MKLKLLLVSIAALSLAISQGARAQEATFQGLPAGSILKVGTGGVADTISIPASISKIKRGTVTLVAGVGTVADTTVTANTLVIPFRQTAAGTPGVTLLLTRTNGTSFTVTSKAADGTTTATSDTSVVGYLQIEP